MALTVGQRVRFPGFTRNSWIYGILIRVGSQHSTVKLDAQHDIFGWRGDIRDVPESLRPPGVDHYIGWNISNSSLQPARTALGNEL